MLEPTETEVDISSSVIQYTPKLALSMDKYFVYKLYDKAGTLLFIGVTVNFVDRLIQHSRVDSWYKEIDLSATQGEGYDDRAKAYKGRKEALLEYSPKYSAIYKGKEGGGWCCMIID